MRITFAILIAAAVLAGGTRVAAAGPKVKIDFLCGTYVDDQITDIVPSAKHPRLTQPVACVVHLSKPSQVTYHATISTVRHLSAANGDHTDAYTDGTSGDITHQPGEDASDLEVVMTPGKENANGEVAFDSCEDFDLIARVSDDGGGEVFEKTLKVIQKCPHYSPPPEPPPPGHFEGKGVGNEVVDLTLSGDASQPFRAYGVQIGDTTYYVAGGCNNNGVELNCEAWVLDRRGKVQKDVAVSINDPYNEEQPDYTELETARADLDEALGHEQGYQLTAHELGPEPLRYDVIGLKWDPAKAVLTVLNNDKRWKTVKAPKTPRGMRVSGAVLYYLEGGDPGVGILRVDRVVVEGSGYDSVLAVAPLPPVPVD